MSDPRQPDLQRPDPHQPSLLPSSLLPSGPLPPVSPIGIDPRGPRVGAAITALLLVVVLLLSGGAATALLAVIAALFALGTARGPQGSVQGLIFRRLVRPRLAPPAELEDPRPPRFAQLVGLVITGIGVLLGLAGVTAAVPVAAALALVAAFLNSAFGVCLGCELYLLGVRLRSRAA
ncbi:MAG: DUF4395 domain-containing protein [Cellulomonas sp.]